MRHLALVALLFPAAAFAQPAPSAPPPAPSAPTAPVDPAAPAPAADPAAPPAAPAPAPAPAAGPGAPAGAPTYYQPVPVYGPPPVEQPQSLHNGMTFEANLGFGWIKLTDDGNSETFGTALAGLSLGVGGWLSPKLALTGRIAGVTYTENGARLTDAFLGPSLQYWVDDHFWFGGGAGLGVVAVSNDAGDSDSVTGISLDLRLGYTFNAGSENTINASFEVNPGWYSDNGSSGTGTAIGFLLGYQHL